MTILSRCNMGRIDGRITVVNHNKVVFSCHYRDLKHRQQLIDAINEIIRK